MAPWKPKEGGEIVKTNSYVWKNSYVAIFSTFDQNFDILK